MTTLTIFQCLVALLVPISGAHSWVEEYQVISDNGTYIGPPGFSRGYVSRSMFPALQDGDKPMSYELPTAVDQTRLRINASDSLCKPSQRTSNYSNPAFPKLRVSPGNYVAMKYLENGHVTLPWTLAGKPEQGGTVFIYGTTQPSNDEKLVDVLEWTKDGNGGDGRGFLISAQNFDDGRCHQVNSCILSTERQILYPNRPPGQSSGPSGEQWCESDVQIPPSQSLGTLTVYWVWQWTTGDMADCNFAGGKDEYYTTCADFDIVDPQQNVQLLKADASRNSLVPDNFQTAAVSDWASRTALTASPVVILAPSTTGPPIASLKAADTQNAGFWSSCSSVASAAAAAVSAGLHPTPAPACPEGKWATGALLASISSSLMASPPQATSSTPSSTSTSTSIASPTSSSTSMSAPITTPSAGLNYTRHDQTRVSTLTVRTFVTHTEMAILTVIRRPGAFLNSSATASSVSSPSVQTTTTIVNSKSSGTETASSAQTASSVADADIVFPTIFTIGVPPSSSSPQESSASLPILASPTNSLQNSTSNLKFLRNRQHPRQLSG